MKIQLVSQPGQAAATTQARSSGPANRTGGSGAGQRAGVKRQGRPQQQQKKKELTAEELDADLDAFVKKAN